MKHTIFHDSRVGTRAYNQDRVGHWSTGESLLLVLADGMGGHVRGEFAAQIAVDYLGAAFRAEAKPRMSNPDQFLLRAIGRAHAMIAHQGQKLVLPDMPRTTVVACVVQDAQAWWSFVGDSRLYLIRDGRVVTRTRDHTIVQQLVDAGRIREESVAAHPDRNKLLRCLGGPVAPGIERAENARLCKGDIVLLCSDGFWGPLTQRQLLVGLIGREPAQALPDLIRLAEVSAGAHCDNVSVLALHWLEDATPEVDDLATVPGHAMPGDVERQIDEIKAALKNRSSGNQ